MIDEEDLWEAYLEGFRQSGEGWNGEYPYWNSEQRRENMKAKLYEKFEEWNNSR